jgi:hypothetical protein
MTSVSSACCRTLLTTSLVLMSLIFSGTANAEKAAPLPDYVIEQFGQPPTIPEGPLSEELQAAVRVVFIDSLETSTWLGEQVDALEKIANSKDPRLAWIIIDMM